jgi:hypothetical protein
MESVEGAREKCREPPGTRPPGARRQISVRDGHHRKQVRQGCCGTKHISQLPWPLRKSRTPLLCRHWGRPSTRSPGFLWVRRLLPPWRFKKGENPVPGYAYPCAAVGTLLLVAGMLLCGHVVEGATNEETYHTMDGRTTRLVWLQPTTTVNDQAFNSFAVFSKGDQTVITTSRRLRDAGAKRHKYHQHVLEVKTVVGVFIGIAGFLIQFIGLRGMHWSASIAQLIAVLMMTILRSTVRRGFASPPGAEPLSSGFELEWFATSLGDRENPPWMGNSQGPSSVVETHARSLKNFVQFCKMGVEVLRVLCFRPHDEGQDEPEKTRHLKVWRVVSPDWHNWSEEEDRDQAATDGKSTSNRDPESAIASAPRSSESPQAAKLSSSPKSDERSKPDGCHNS